VFERPRGGERALLVQLDIGSPSEPERLEEFRLLAGAAGAEVVGELGGARSAPDPRLYIGVGKAEELRQLVDTVGAELVIFNHALSPGQERNLERLLECRVVDRTGLILDIFAQRARSFEGKLQVELAQLKHLSTRLVRGWTHLERQKGGIGLRGPGETQLETDRRLLAQRIAMLTRRLGRIESQRAQGRRARAKAELPVVSLVGYTNAGKSTLFNRLTRAGVLEADQLFATLDPTLRRLDLPEGRILLADTVGFVSELPHELVAAFRATLEEARNASLLIHVVDAAAPERVRMIADVELVLEEIGSGDIRRLEVWNKIDLLGDAAPARVDRNAEGLPVRVWLSARTGEGMGLLMAALSELTGGIRLRRRLSLGPTEGRSRAWLYDHATILADHPLETGGWAIELLVSPADLDRLAARDPALGSRLRALS